MFTNSPWDVSLADEDISKNWENWKNLYFAAVDERVPKYQQRTKSNAPWITKELNKLFGKKRNLYKKAKRSNNEDHWIAYRNLNNLLKRKCNLQRWKYLESLAGKLKVEDNPKPFWNYVKSLGKRTSNLVLLKEGNIEVTRDQDIAACMNDYFSKVFTSEQDTVPGYDYVTFEKLNKMTCSIEEVTNHLRTLNQNKSPGPDQISPHIVKQSAIELSISLCNLFNKSFYLGILPIDWKTVNITPIHKKRPKHNKENYRQISLTSIISKVAEKIVKSRVMIFLD